MVSMETGMRHDHHMAARLDLLGRNINSIVGNLWQRQEEQGSGSSNGNISPGSGGSGPESPSGGGGVRGDHHDTTTDDKQSMTPSIGIRSDLLPAGHPLAGVGGGLMNDLSGLPALEALRRQAGSQNPFAGCGPLGLPPLKRPSQPPTPQSSSSGGDPSAAWSFEEQFKQLYEIDDNPKRKEFLDDLFAFMQKRGTPINRLPIMAKQVLDLYELYNLVVARGGLVEVINKKQWQEIIKGLGLPSSITSAAFTLRTQYTKYLYPLEMNQHNFSTGGDLQNAIDGNKREGRRLGPYDTPPVSSQSALSPFSSHHLPPHHHRLSAAHSPPTAQSSPPPHHHMNAAAAAAAAAAHQHQAAMQAAAAAAAAAAAGQHHPDPLAQLEMTRLALWKLYSQGQQQQPPPHLLPPLDLDHLSSQQRRREHQEQQQRKEEERRRRGEEARRRLLEVENEQRLVATTAPLHHQVAEKRTRDEEPELREDDGAQRHLRDNDEGEEEAAKRRRVHEEEQEEEQENMEHEEEEEERAADFSVEMVQGKADQMEGKSMKISMEVNGILYSGILYAQPS